MPWLTREAADFLGELALNNDREWFAANKKRYESSVKLPMERLAEELIPRMQAYDSAIAMTPKQAVFRIHRDTRFAKDKAPYKTNAGMSISSVGRHGTGKAGLYVHLEATRFGIASGYYFLEPAQIATVRRHLMANPAELQSQLEDPAFVKYFGEIAGERNKILPEEFKEAAKNLPLLLNKQFFYWAEYDPTESERDDLPEFIMAHVQACWPMNTFLGKAF